MKKLLISITIAGLFLAITLPQGATAQNIVKTDKQYIVVKMTTDPMATNTFTPWGLPTVAIDKNTSRPQALPVEKPRQVPVQSVSKKKPKKLNM